MIQMVPDQRFAVIIVSNKSGETLPLTRTKALELSLKLKPETAEKPRAAQPLSEAEMTNFAGTYRNGPQTWEVYVKDGKLYLKQEGGDVALSRTGRYRLSYGPALDNDLAFVPDARGRMEYVFDGLYSAKKDRERKPS
jgi:hypothetical protein